MIFHVKIYEKKKKIRSGVGDLESSEDKNIQWTTALLPNKFHQRNFERESKHRLDRLSCRIKFTFFLSYWSDIINNDRF